MIAALASASRLVVLAAGVAAVLVWVAEVTEPRIAVNRDRAIRAELAALAGDPAFADSDVVVPAGDDFDLCAPGVAPARILRARGPGYGGDVELLLAIGAHGRLRGVRVTAHRETPGIGDAIEASRSGWIHGFDGLPADATRPPWTGPGPPVDAIAGATITSRAVTEAVRARLLTAGGRSPCRP